MTDIPADLVKLATDAVDQHHIRTIRRDGTEVCTCGLEVPGSGPGRSAKWEKHYAEATLAAVIPAIRQQVHDELRAALETQGKQAAAELQTASDQATFTDRLNTGLACKRAIETLDKLKDQT